MLKCYKQDFAWEYHWKIIYQQKYAEKIFKKLCKHFKINAKVSFTNYKKGMACFTYHIKLPKRNIKLGIIAHEIGHLLAYKYGVKGHNKKAYKYIHRIYRYSIKYIPTWVLLGINKEQLLLT